ncbi:MAG: hypothetical protein AB9834_17760 [Lentimicrobium sp.]
MRNNFLITCIFILAIYNSSIAQDIKEKSKPAFSFELFVLYPHYFLECETQFNYGFGGVLSQNYKPFRITTGLFYTSKKYYNSFESSDNIDRITYSIDYYNIPVLIGFPLNKQEVKKNKFLIETGFIFNIPRNYQSFTYYTNGSPKTINETPGGYEGGCTFRLAFQFRRKLNNAFNVFSGVFTDYKFLMDDIRIGSSQSNWHPSYSEDRFMVGINVGFGWTYKKR